LNKGGKWGASSSEWKDKKTRKYKKREVKSKVGSSHGLSETMDSRYERERGVSNGCEDVGEGDQSALFTEKKGTKPAS